MERGDIIAFLGNDWTRTVEVMRASLSSDIPMLDALNESLFGNGGKCIRPLISLLMARACGRLNDDSVRLAAASELLHNATLFHDDVADESATRRGRATLFALMGPSPAVLVGDFWLARSVELIISTKCKDEAVRLFALTLSHLAEGEMLQLEKAAKADTTEEDYLRIVYSKTASLFETICRTGALSSGADKAMIEAAGRFGKAAGIAFQIRDDIFDYSPELDTGKPSGADLREGKITLPLLGAIRGSAEEKRIRALVADIPGNPEACAEVQAFVLEHGGIEYAASRLQDFIAEALEALEAFPPSEEREMLAALARSNAYRTV